MNCGLCAVIMSSLRSLLRRDVFVMHLSVLNKDLKSVSKVLLPKL